METLILGWYVLTETGSVMLLTLFASLQYLGTLIAPMFGVVGDRIGHRTLLSGMRAVYAALAATVMVLAFTDILAPFYVLIIAGLTGLVRPSDIGMRAALVGETMPPVQLMSAMSIQRTTQDSARIAGALSGAGLVVLLGMGPAYAVVSGLYLVSVVLTLKAGTKRVKTARSAHEPAIPSPWRDLRSGLAYVWRTPHLRALMCLAFLLNLTAFPLMTGLLPYVAKEVYHADRIWLGYMVAAAAFGALLGSLTLSRYGSTVRSGRMSIVFAAAWFVMLLVFSQVSDPRAGLVALMFAGCVQSLGLVPMTTALLRTSDENFRGRIMGIRMLAIYGNLPGLLLSGPLIASFGYPFTAAMYCAFGLVFTLIITIHWRGHLWHATAIVNRRH
jgi:MFS family permease